MRYRGHFMVYNLANNGLGQPLTSHMLPLSLHPLLMFLPHPNKNMTRTGEKHTVPTNESHTFPQVQ